MARQCVLTIKPLNQLLAPHCLRFRVFLIYSSRYLINFSNGGMLIRLTLGVNGCYHESYGWLLVPLGVAIPLQQRIIF
jgi:hypothetical protein